MRIFLQLPTVIGSAFVGYVDEVFDNFVGVENIRV
jgi:hypothetical protein